MSGSVTMYGSLVVALDAVLERGDVLVGRSQDDLVEARAVGSQPVAQLGSGRVVDDRDPDRLRRPLLEGLDRRNQVIEAVMRQDDDVRRLRHVRAKVAQAPRTWATHPDRSALVGADVRDAPFRVLPSLSLGGA